MKEKIAVIGLGYVGLPLAVALAQHFEVLGFDINERRIKEIQEGHDQTAEVTPEELKETTLKVTACLEDLKNHNIYIITVPTPVDKNNKPDLTPLEKASETVGKSLSKGSIVVYESTVYPGVTEEICGPILENASGLKVGEDFYLGYSPERINPGDRVHTVRDITKVVAGQNFEISQRLSHIYGKVTNGNIFIAANIKTAEAAKVIENAQRDINIAFINEISMIFAKLGLSTHEVLEAARTKWNFLNFTPGLVGGHCIGVDPFYLAECAQRLGHHPEVILAGRKINDHTAYFIAEEADRRLKVLAPDSSEKKVLILGLTFKENVPDLRNTKVIDIYHALKNLGYDVKIHDPVASVEEAQQEYNIHLLSSFEEIEAEGPYACIIGAVPHEAYKISISDHFINKITAPKSLIVDIKALWKNLELPEGKVLWLL